MPGLGQSRYPCVCLACMSQRSSIVSHAFKFQGVASDANIHQMHISCIVVRLSGSAAVVAVHASTRRGFRALAVHTSLFSTSKNGDAAFFCQSNPQKWPNGRETCKLRKMGNGLATPCAPPPPARAPRSPARGET